MEKEFLKLINDAKQELTITNLELDALGLNLKYQIVCCAFATMEVRDDDFETDRKIIKFAKFLFDNYGIQLNQPLARFLEYYEDSDLNLAKFITLSQMRGIKNRASFIQWCKDHVALFTIQDIVAHKDAPEELKEYFFLKTGNEIYLNEDLQAIFLVETKL